MNKKTFWQENITIGNLSVPRFMAAPLDGITDSPLRQLIREFSPTELLMGEMRHVACVSNEKKGHSVKYKQLEHPLAYQFSANTDRFIDQAVERVIASGFIMINLNCGCPAHQVTKSGSGSALMANIPNFVHLSKKFMKAIDGRVPFTVKMRAGFKEKNAVEFAKAAEDNGAACIMIHPRTQPERFASRLDYELTAKVKAAVKVPVIFSGNINRFAQAERVHEMTGVDGFMIGRALWGAPWKMKEITEAAQGREWTVDLQTTLEYTLKHLNLNMEHFGERGFVCFKKQLPQYIRGIDNASEMRSALLRSQTEDEMRALLNTVFIENGVTSAPSVVTTGNEQCVAL